MKYKEKKYSNNSIVKSALKITKALEDEKKYNDEDVQSEEDIICRSINSQKIVDE